MSTLFLLIAVLCCACAKVEICKEAKESYTVTTFGAVGDGKTDDTAAIQEALNAAAKAGGGVVELPAGMYRIEAHLEIPGAVTLQGIWQAPHHSSLPQDVTGTVLLALEGKGTEDGPALITLSQNAALRGITIHYPDQDIDNVVPYPWAIRGTGMHSSIENVTFVNAYNGIDFRARHELHYIRNVFGLCLRRGIWVDNCTDIGRIENVHFNPHYWQRSPFPNAPTGEKWQTLIDYITKNGEGFIFGRSDWEYVHNTFCFGYNIGYHFIEGQSGPMNGNFLGIGSDGSNVAVQVDAANPYGILITNGEFVSMFQEHPIQIVTGPKFKGVLQLNNCSFWGPTHSCAELRGTGHVSFQQCNFVHWYKGSYAIRAEEGTLSVVNCRFREPAPQIYLGENLKSAVIMGNTFKFEEKIENKSKGKVEIGLNVDDVKVLQD